VQKPDVLAPDNPFAAGTHDVWPHGAVFVFGGTSGSSPHVTGVAALLAQAGIKGDAARDAMRDSAIADAATGSVPNKDYGYGRLNAAGALGAKMGAALPSVTLSAPATARDGDSIDLVPTAEDGAGTSTGVEATWDDGYDGSWDVPYAAVATRTVTYSSAGPHVYKVRVRNAGGLIAEAIAMVALDTSEPDPGPKDAPHAAEGEAEDGGCGCRTAVGWSGRASYAAYASLGGLLAASLWARRRKRRLAGR
jgi:hypothetical protein